jgi:phosphotransferase system  glucose/maltose/N-acetylglucosamine-specific IIC component
MADPLSSATRAVKRNLLIASVLAISANAFNVSVDKIPVGGLSVNFDSRLFAFLLVVTLLYFFCTFVIYYAIDMKNLEPTTHQQEAEKKSNSKINGFNVNYKSRVGTDLISWQGLHILSP